MTATAEPEDAAPLLGDDHVPQFLGHPRGLWYLAFTEAWERFSFYGMQALLVLYMVKYLLQPGRIEHVLGFEFFHRLPLYNGLEGQALASAIFGTYSASVYLTPIFGGFLADRLLGRRRTVLLGALTMAAGHFLMAFEPFFLLALLCLVLGCGMFKGNIASQVGALYKPDDLRRADAFQIFYLGINAGVIASPAHRRHARRKSRLALRFRGRRSRHAPGHRHLRFRAEISRRRRGRSPRGDRRERLRAPHLPAAIGALSSR